MQQGYKKIKINKKDSVLNEQDMAVDIGTNITRARLLCGYTQKELAKKMKTTQPSLARYERGSQMPGNRFLIRIANALNTNVVAPTFECLEQRNKSVKNVELNNNSITDIRFVVTYDAHPQVTKSIAQASPSPYAQAFGLKPISTNNNQPII